MTTSDWMGEAYVLHSRPYRDSSSLVDFFSAEHGRFTAVARGVRGQKRAPVRVQPFSPLLVSVLGRGELKTVKDLESSSVPYTLIGRQLYIGLYVNELLYRLLGKFEHLPGLFDEYERLLGHLAEVDFEEIWLRLFELNLLSKLGYGVTFSFDARTGECIVPEAHYRYVADEGFIQVDGVSERIQVYPGSQLLAISSGQLAAPEARQIIKQITRAAITRCLGGRPLKSRELFVRSLVS